MAATLNKSPNYDEPFSLVPINFNDAAETEELLSQRKVCGWCFTQKDIDKWHKEMSRGSKTLFWIVLTERNDIRAGHIALAREEDPPELDLANPDGSLLTITQFFIMPECRSLGLGRLVMDRMEEMAAEEPYGSKNCKAVTVNTLARRWVEDDDLRWRWADMGLPAPPKGVGASVEDWYARRGYVKFKEEPRYNGHTNVDKSINFTASFLRKELH